MLTLFKPWKEPVWNGDFEDKEEKRKREIKHLRKLKSVYRQLAGKEYVGKSSFEAVFNACMRVKAANRQYIKTGKGGS